MIFNLVWLPARQTGSSIRTKVLLRIMLRDTTVCEDDVVKQALRESQYRPDRRHAGAQGDDPKHPDPKIMRPAHPQPDTQGHLRVRPADPQHLHAALPARSPDAKERPSVTEPHRVIPPVAGIHYAGQRKKAADRQD